MFAQDTHVKRVFRMFKNVPDVEAYAKRVGGIAVRERACRSSLKSQTESQRVRVTTRQSVIVLRQQKHLRCRLGHAVKIATR